MESRVAYCASEDGKLHKEEMCSGKKKPDLERKCSVHAHCQAMWFASEWSKVRIYLTLYIYMLLSFVIVMLSIFKLVFLCLVL